MGGWGNGRDGGSDSVERSNAGRGRDWNGNGRDGGSRRTAHGRPPGLTVRGRRDEESGDLALGRALGDGGGGRVDARALDGRVDGSSLTATLVPKFCACGATTCRAGRDWVVGESTQLASRASHTRSPSHLPRALTHAAASWPAVPPTSDGASGLIVDWVFMSPLGWSGHKPAGSNGWGAAGMLAGARITKAELGIWSVVLVWVRQWLIGRHAEAVARLNC